MRALYFTAGFTFCAALLLAALAYWLRTHEVPGVEGPYRRAEVQACVCKEAK